VGWLFFFKLSVRLRSRTHPSCSHVEAILSRPPPCFVPYKPLSAMSMYRPVPGILLEASGWKSESEKELFGGQDAIEEAWKQRQDGQYYVCACL
jgi:hypothetical protein